jgi:two-component system sensor histidine kinase ChiS
MENNARKGYLVYMFLKNVFDSIAIIHPLVQPGLLSFWLALLAFSLALSVFRKLAVVYRVSILYYLVMVIVFALPFMALFFKFDAFPFVLMALAISRATFALVTRRVCDLLVGKTWNRISFVVAVLGVAAGSAVLILGSGTYAILEAYSAVLFAFHALLSVFFFARVPKLVPAGRRLLAGSVPWALIWTVAAVLLVLRFYGASLPSIVTRFLAPGVVAADGLMGLVVMFAMMLELAKPAPEDTALDDYTAKVDASIHRFIPTEFLHHLEKNDFHELKLGDHVKKDMTIFFSDIRAFTELSEQLTPEESFAFVNSYLSRVVPIIKTHGGFIDKYMGDGIMALFADARGADQAVESAVEMQVKMVEYNGHRAKMEYRPISMGIGIHTGPLMLGVVGVLDRMEGTVISDAVNLSSRLQSIAKAFNIPLVISERTFMQLDDPGKYKYRFIGKVRVKGKDAPVSVFEIFDGLPEQLFERKMRSNTFFEQGMMAYYQKDYSQGVFYFKRALENVPEDGASRFYLETCLRKAIAPKPLEKKTESPE